MEKELLPTLFQGTFYIALWTLAVAFFTHAYFSNLRAALIMQERETPMNTWQDALDSNQDVYFPGNYYVRCFTFSEVSLDPCLGV